MSAWEPQPSADELDSLAAAAADGDSAARDALLLAIQPRVLRLCERMLPCPQDAEEACQDALMQVVKNLDRFEGRSRFTTWLHAVATNSARQTYRKLKKRFAEQPFDQLPVDADPRTTSVVAGCRLDFLEALEDLQEKRPHLIEPLVLRDVGELDYNEIARVLGIPVGTAKSRVHDARVHVRPALLLDE
jgi:RNA polymerase sigma-70 factor (ECF subfamily)